MALDNKSDLGQLWKWIKMLPAQSSEAESCTWTLKSYLVFLSPGWINKKVMKNFQSPLQVLWIQSTATFIQALSNKASLCSVGNTDQRISYTADTAAFDRNCREVKVLPCCFHVTNPSLHSAICQGQLFHRCGKEIWAITIFEQQDSGKWESWSAAHKCNWSPGIFTQGLINMPLKHSRHICPQNKDTADNDDQKFLNFYQLLTDKVFECLGHSSLMWIDRYARSLKGAVIFKKPDRIKKKMVIFGVSKSNINIKALSSNDSL